ncbi:hypothetical protein BFJ66_g17180 [Fusarium oxysporum f. sp. cepae]|nr:hypothetical protein BFJ65_g18580 [Fusarium oxysporum f. sp. cepae]RKK21514.1 hypothetical protein BFJ67_g17237 [Fusarium oxysporum f. sp. cepae]RKK24224.1 hypothetical protein BFJ66_g17180 [Fusarium oxysporum f. sp. cepae]
MAGSGTRPYFASMVSDSASQGSLLPETSPQIGRESHGTSSSRSGACLACRARHVKCSGQQPCSRCSDSNSECVYVTSRRGRKDGGRPTSLSALDVPTKSPNRVLMESNTSSPAKPICFDDHPSHVGGDQVPEHSLIELCLDAFYHHFHQAHPFVLPKRHFALVSESNREPLLATMRWIGSFYLNVGIFRDVLFHEAYRLSYGSGHSKDGFLIQALILLVIGLDGSGELERARAVLADAAKLAIQMSLNTNDYAASNGRGMPILEESWRRTWWDLFVVDSMVAGIHRATNFLPFEVPTDVALPCEEHDYFEGNIPQPVYLEDLEDSQLSGDERNFSSFAYRISSARILGKFITSPPISGFEDENLIRIEALLTNWWLSLPRHKRDTYLEGGRFDEMMFQAHMIMHLISILLHQQHSQLDLSLVQEINACAPHRPVPCQEAFNTHTTHTIQSANKINKMITSPIPLLSHTHFFGCVVSFSSRIHLSKWALYSTPQDEDEMRQQIRLSMGALREMAEVWKAAEQSADQVNRVAQRLYRAKKEQQIPSQSFLGGFLNDVLSSSAAVDDPILGEAEAMDEAQDNHSMAEVSRTARFQ